MNNLINRIKSIVDICWESFSAKIGCGLIEINKEASMQLHFAYILKNTLDIAIHNEDEKVTIELETTIKIGNRPRECDIVIKIEKGNEIVYLPIEMKCYREYASSGGKRGALDLFVKEVYADIELLECYSKNKCFLNGILLVMTDLKRVVFPEIKKGKYWDYDISNGTTLQGIIQKTTPMGGKKVNIKIEGNYYFQWNEYKNFYFVKLENRI